MIVYTYSEARQKLATLLEQAVTSGEVKIRRRDGQVFVIRPETPSVSPLDVEGMELKVTTEEIVQIVREGRQKYGLEVAYRQMSQDEQREAEALDWSEATVGDVRDETR